MRRFMKYFFAMLMLTMSFCFQLAAAPAVNGSAVLATVDGEVVTLGDLLRENSGDEGLARLYADRGKVSDEIARLRRQALDRIIDRKLLIAEFKRLNLTLPVRYVESMIDDMAENLGCTSRSELNSKLRSMNLSMNDLRKLASERLMAEIVVARELHTAASAPTPQEIDEYFRKHKQEFSQPLRLDMALLMLPQNTEEKVINDIAAKLAGLPGAFPELVKAFSKGPNQEKGGSIGWVEAENLRKEFKQVLPVDAVAADKVYGPVKTDEGIYFLQVKAVAGNQAARLEDHRDAIREKLTAESRAKAVDALLKRLRQRAHIQYFTELAPEIIPSENKTITTITEPEKQPVKKTTEKKIMVTLKTNYGDIKLELFADAAPKTVANFLEYVKSGFYNGTLFHRVIDNFMIQGGGFDQKFKQKATRAPIENEADNRLSNEIGTIAMARTMDPHSATAQFFINVANNDFLDFRSPTPQFYGYCVFGKVVEGMDVVNRIKEVKTGNRGGHQDVPKEDVVILEAVID